MKTAIPAGLVAAIEAGLRARFPARDWTFRNSNGEPDVDAPYIEAETRIGRVQYRARYEFSSGKLAGARKVERERGDFAAFVGSFVEWVARNVEQVERDRESVRAAADVRIEQGEEHVDNEDA